MISCLLFVAAIQGAPMDHLPASVVEMAKERIQTQVQARLPSVEILWDQGQCPDQVAYQFGVTRIRLDPKAGQAWKSSRELSLSAVLEGERFDLPMEIDSSSDLSTLMPQASQMAHDKYLGEKRKLDRWERVQPWIWVGIATVATVAVVQHQRGKNNVAGNPVPVRVR
jgi:hypothetical protein